jgi:hypothetical protein
MVKIFPNIFSVPYLVAVLTEAGEIGVKIVDYLNGIDPKICNTTVEK